MIGRVILSGLAFFQVVATPFYDFDRRHVFNPAWPPHARYHAAALTLLHMALGALSLWLLWLRPELTVLAALLLSFSSAVTLTAALVPGVSRYADGDRSFFGHPISLWMMALYLLLTIVGWLLV